MNDRERVVYETLKNNDWSRVIAASILGVSISAISHYIRRHNLPVPQHKSNGRMPVRKQPNP